MKTRFLFLVLPAIFIFPSSLAAETQPAQQVIETFVANIKSMEFPPKDAAKQAELVQRTNQLIDLETMGRKALGEHWEQAGLEERKKFTGLLWKLIENVAYPNSVKFMGAYEITYPEVKADASGFLVHSVVKQEEQALDASVIYHVSEKGGQFKVDDVILDDVSIIEDLKYQFDKLIAKSGFTGLLDKMKERLVQAEKANAPV